jgi:hypothetical protein
MFNLVGVEIIPDSLFTDGITSSTLLNQISIPNDGNFDYRSPDSLRTRYANARFSLQASNETLSTS